MNSLLFIWIALTAEVCEAHTRPAAVLIDEIDAGNFQSKLGIFGIPFGAKYISVHIELRDYYEVVPDGYRQFLRYAQGEQPNVAASDFAELIREHRSQWLVDIIHSFAPDGMSATSEKCGRNLKPSMPMQAIPRRCVHRSNNMRNGRSFFALGQGGLARPRLGAISRIHKI